MRLVILEVLSNLLLWVWGHSGDLTADFAPVVGNLTARFVKSPVFPHPPRGWGVGHEIKKCINYTVRDGLKYKILNDSVWITAREATSLARPPSLSSLVRSGELFLALHWI